MLHWFPWNVITSNDSPEIITVKFEHYSALRIRIGNTSDISYNFYKITTVKMTRHMEIVKIESFLNFSLMLSGSELFI